MPRTPGGPIRKEAAARHKGPQQREVRTEEAESGAPLPRAKKAHKQRNAQGKVRKAVRTANRRGGMLVRYLQASDEGSRGKWRKASAAGGGSGLGKMGAQPHRLQPSGYASPRAREERACPIFRAATDAILPLAFLRATNS